MIYLHGKDLADRFIASWGIGRRDWRAEVRQAVAEEPRRMARILLLSELLYCDVQRSCLPTATAADGLTARALLARSPAGIEVLEMVLTDIFVAVAPRPIFDLEGETTDPRFTAAILCRLLQRRRELGHRAAVVYNPLARHLDPVDRMNLRLAAALTTLLNDAGDCDPAELICAAAADGSDIVRHTAVRGAAGFVGFAGVRAVLENAVDDDNALLRCDALEALAPLAGRREVAESIAWFTADHDPAIRLRAFRLIMESSPHRPHRELLVELAFDPAREVAEAARAHFGEDELRRYLIGLAERAAEGGLQAPFYMRILGSSPLLDPALRDRAFLAQLRELRCRQLAGERLAELLQALRPWQQEVGTDLRQEIAAALSESSDPCLLPLKYLIAETRP